MLWFLFKFNSVFGSKCAPTKPAHREADGINDESLELGEVQHVASQADENGIEAPMKRPIAYSLILIWGIIETVLLITLMFMANKQEPPKLTFMNGRCSTDEESQRIASSEMIIYKIVTSTLLVIGGKSVSKKRFSFTHNT